MEKQYSRKCIRHLPTYCSDGKLELPTSIAQEQREVPALAKTAIPSLGKRCALRRVHIPALRGHLLRPRGRLHEQYSVHEGVLGKPKDHEGGNVGAIHKHELHDMRCPDDVLVRRGEVG